MKTQFHKQKEYQIILQEISRIDPSRVTQLTIENELQYNGPDNPYLTRIITIVFTPPIEQLNNKQQKEPYVGVNINEDERQKLKTDLELLQLDYRELQIDNEKLRLQIDRMKLNRS